MIPAVKAQSRAVSAQWPRTAVMADGRLFVLGEGGLLGLFEVNAEKPVELGRHQVPELRYPCWAAPILSDKRMVIRSEDYLICFDVAK